MPAFILRQGFGGTGRRHDGCNELVYDELHENGEFFLAIFVVVVESQVDAFHFETKVSVEVDYGGVGALRFEDDLT